jgi:hypothetical protein
MLFVLVGALGCAGKGKVVTASPMSSGGSMISIEAAKNKFTPSEVRVEKPGLLAIEVRNVSGSKRTFTLNDPRGKVLKKIDIQPAGTVIFNVELSDSGVYRFYLDRSFLSLSGTKGQIVVGR